MTVYATLADVDARYPDELAQLAARQSDGVRDDVKIGLALEDVSTEIDAVLLARWRRDELARIDEPSLVLLKSFAVRMSLHVISLAFSRASEPVEKAYSAAKASLRDLIKGDGAITFDPDPAAPSVAPQPGEAAIGNTAVLIEADERMFTRARTRGL